MSHKAIEVNGKIVNIPSYQVKAERRDCGPRARRRSSCVSRQRCSIAKQVGLPEWVEVDDQKMSGKFKAVPERTEILPDINENLVVELYSK